MENIYFKKYLKYKTKYINMKGGNGYTPFTIKIKKPDTLLDYYITYKASSAEEIDKITNFNNNNYITRILLNPVKREIEEIGTKNIYTIIEYNNATMIFKIQNNNDNSKKEISLNNSNVVEVSKQFKFI
jgi:hypothetical protein